MQSQDNNQYSVAQDATGTPQGTVMPAVETITLASIGKWLTGLILVPWLWYERKRVDALQTKLESYYTKEEVKEKIEDKLEPMKRDISWIRKHLENK